MTDRQIGFTRHHFGGVGSGVPIVYCFDVDFAKYAAVSVYSLHKNATTPPRIFWVVTPSSFEGTAHVARQLEKIGVDLTIIKVDEEIFSTWRRNKHYTSAMYLRFLVPYLFEEDRAVYIDCDTIVQTDLQPLATVDMGEALLGGVIDDGGWSSGLTFPEGEPYLNSGMLVMDLKKLKEDNFLGKCEAIYSQYFSMLRYPDQDILNKYAEGKKAVLDPKWNSLVRSNRISIQEWADLKQTAAVLHFIGTPKPWMGWCNPFTAHYWWEIANASPVEGLELIPMETLSQYHWFANSLALTGGLVDAYNIDMHLVEMLLNDGADKDTKVVLPFTLEIAAFMEETVKRSIPVSK